MRMFKFATSVFVSAMLASSTSYADVSVNVEPGVAVPLTKPQTERFNPGGAVSVKALFSLSPNLDIGPVVSAVALPSTISGIETGVGWGAGGGLRLKRSYDNDSAGVLGMAPWVDGDLQYIRTGPLNRAALSFAAGVAVPTSDARNLWLGPFVRYQDIIQGVRTGFDNTDAHILIVGLSAEFGTSHRKVDNSMQDSDNDGTPDVTDRCPYVPGPKDNFGCPVVVEVPTPKPVRPRPEKPVVVPQKFELTQRIPFEWDSALLGGEAEWALEEVVSKLLENVDYNVKIEGHASSEGQVEHNNVLSQKRADAVLNFLVTHGVSRDRLTATGFGSSVPVADNRTEVGREQNRRVEFVVVITVVAVESK